MYRAVSGTAVMAMEPTHVLSGVLTQVKPWPYNARDFKFHMIGHAHIDPVWLWPWSEGVSVTLSTFRSALDRMEETPEFCFTASSAQLYQWVADNDPEMLAEIKKRIDEGRWNIVGGWWVEPDVNIPCGESLVRQGLYGQRTFQRLLGHRARVAFNPDSFGHTNTLPQVFHLQGMDNYVFMRPGPHEKSLPSDLFWWEGADGTKVLTYRIQFGYGNRGPMKDRLEKTLNECGEQRVNKLMSFFGAGDHGGAPAKENIHSINELKTEKGAPEIVFSTTDHYFDEVRSDMRFDFPVVNGDLQHHAIGCYTAESGIKKANRQSEASLITAEKINAIGSVVWGVLYPGAEITAAWQRVLFLQFHDSSAGTSIWEHSQHAREGYGYAMDIAQRATFMAIQKLEWRVPSEDPGSEYLVVVNPHAWEVQGNIEYDFYRDNMQSSCVVDEKGNPLSHQWTNGSSQTGSRKKLVVSTKVPPMGYRQIRLMDGRRIRNSRTVSASENTLENEFLRVGFSTDGALGLFDKEYGMEVFTGGHSGCKAIVIDDPSDTWSHNVKSFSDEVGAFKNARIKILENGPLRSTIRVTTTYSTSTLKIDWTLYSGSRYLEAKVNLDWHEQLKMLKFSFPVAMNSPVAVYETPYGTIERATNGDEDPGQRWIDVTGKRNNSTYGLTVLNDAKYGYNVTGNELRISIVRSPVYAHHIPKVLDKTKEYIWMDQGIQTFRILLVPHKDTWKESNIVRIAEEFIAPLIPIYQGIHGGSMPKAGSFLAIEPENVIISAVKHSEEGDDIIIRCVECSGLTTTGRIDLHFINCTWTGTFHPYEIKTLRLERSTGHIQQVNLLEES